MSLVVACPTCGTPSGVKFAKDHADSFVIPVGWPRPATTSAVFVTHGAASWLVERCGADGIPGGMWYFEEDLYDWKVPEWWITFRGRRRHPALRFPDHVCGRVDPDHWPGWDFDNHVLDHEKGER